VVAYEVVWESSRTVIIVTASVKEDENGGHGHSLASLLHQSATWHCTVNVHCFKRVLCDYVFCLVRHERKIEQLVYIKFCKKLGNSITDTLEMLPEAFGENSLSRTEGSEWRVHITWRPVTCRWCVLFHLHDAMTLWMTVMKLFRNKSKYYSSVCV
jgi:hypothetical protein